MKIEFYVPNNVVDSNFLQSAFPSFDKLKFEDKIGIKERRVSSSNQSSLELANKFDLEVLGELPISEDLLTMLVQQKEDYGFQEYVAPMPKAIRGAYKPYTLFRLSIVARQVIRLCGLPNELRIADLRRTGTTEMVEAGVSMGQIMSVTGHANPQSVKPYMKNTYASAESALTMRNNHGTSK